MKKTLVTLTVAAFVATGCANMSETQKRTAIGTGAGAVAGAALGSAVGKSGGATRSGALLGAAVGGIGTYIWSQRMEDQKRAMEQATAGTGVTSTPPRTWCRPSTGRCSSAGARSRTRRSSEATTCARSTDTLACAVRSLMKR